MFVGKKASSANNRQAPKRTRFDNNLTQHNSLSQPIIWTSGRRGTQLSSEEILDGHPQGLKKHHSKKRDRWHVGRCNNARSLDDNDDNYDVDDNNDVCGSVLVSIFSFVWSLCLNDVYMFH